MVFKPVSEEDLMRSAIERFDNRYEPDPNSGCWLWTGAIHNSGYGRFSMGRRIILAHRFSYLRFTGVPEDCVLHHCDTPLCVNPQHLFPGTRKTNAEDRDRKGRGLKGRKGLPQQGDKNHRAVLSENDVRAILEAREKGASCALLAALYGVHSSTVYRIVAGVRWPHLGKGETCSS